MTYIFVGLGNPGDDYSKTRHNTGRIILTMIQKMIPQASEWKYDKFLNAEVSKMKISGKPVLFVLPNTFMNNSGKSVKSLVTSAKDAEKMVVIYDDLDLPFGGSKISFNKSSGGHKGLESIIKNIKTEKFPRIRVGISPTTSSGKLRKPQGEDAVMKVIMGEFKPAENLVLKKNAKKIFDAIETIISSGLEIATNNFN